jgi:hypothetical protein
MCMLDIVGADGRESCCEATPLCCQQLRRLESQLKTNTKTTMDIVKLLTAGVGKLEILRAICEEKRAMAANSSPSCLQCNVCMNVFPNHVDEEDTANYIVLLGCGACVPRRSPHDTHTRALFGKPHMQRSDDLVWCAQAIFSVHVASERKTSAQRAEGLYCLKAKSFCEALACTNLHMQSALS